MWPECDREQRYDLPICHIHMDDAYMTARELYEGSPDLSIAQRNARAARNAKAERAFREAERVRESRGSQPGWVYYLQVGDQIKIGYTTNILRRMREYPPGSPLLAAHPGTPDTERQMHHRFRGSLARGREWYRTEPHILKHCEEAVATYGDPAQFEYHARDPQRPAA